MFLIFQTVTELDRGKDFWRGINLKRGEREIREKDREMEKGRKTERN